MLSATKWSGCQYSIPKSYNNHYVLSVADPVGGNEILLRPYQSALWIESPGRWARLRTTNHIDFDHFIEWFFVRNDGTIFAIKHENRIFGNAPYSFMGGISKANLATGQISETIHPEIDDLNYPDELLTKRTEFNTREVYSTDPDEIYFSNHSDVIAINHFDDSIKIWRNLPLEEQQLNVSRFDRLLNLKSDATYRDLNPLPEEITPPPSLPYWKLPADKNYSCISFSADEQFMVASANETIEIFDLETKSKIQTIQLSNYTNCPVLSDDFKFLAYEISSSTKADVVSIVQIDSGEIHQEIVITNADIQWINSFSPDNQRLYIEATDDFHRRFLSGSWTLVFQVK